ncbi:tetratricopeptide repeat protein [Maridesulfovibrio salexigens]|uniref:TPR repeat-containing protein n=1 Tax=Maridesulfovibrio salexigens (strain ATCC 14822 / DSM 2638 / NCIMB 8403 / VKM B-1763) TaxID=526222 RepID=C6C0P2_MARSD|nr:tetratricopeptide repeat protein [Maridesulfovibrio salexigens]ACS80989.1 TPR repeat-containing protein [Maridesulfovibrio salexigens DSM 2638]
MAENTASMPKIKGTFSTKLIQEIGTGTTKRKVIQSFLYFAEEKDNGEVGLRVLNENDVPSGEEQIISKEELLESFTPEVELYTSTVFPAIQKLNKTLAKADRQRQEGNTFTAEMEYGKALNIDEDNIRANFGIGLCYLDRNEADKATDVFSRLIELNAAFELEHKHLFNDFGISLRKNKMFDEAVNFYSRALGLTDDDENLYFNIARCLYEKGDRKGALKNAEKCLGINPKSAPAMKLKKYLKKKVPA